MLYVLFFVLLFILFICIKTLFIHPTSAKTAKINLEENERSIEYGKKLSKMIQVETISSRNQIDLTKFFEFHECLKALFPYVHQNCEKHVFDGNLLFKWKGKKSDQPILLMSHQDVVEATGKWQKEPFSGEIDEQGRVWGRGSVDTKASLFCIFTSIEELIQEGFTPEQDIYIASSCTEEWSGDGAPKIVNYLKENHVQIYMLIDEGGMIIDNPVSGVEGTYAMVGIVEKGYGDIRFTAKSKGGHASAPTKNTPLVRLSKFMVDIEKNNPFKAELTPVVQEMFRRMAPNMNFPMRLLFSNIWLFKPFIVKILPTVSSTAGAMLRTTIAFTMAKGSDGANVLPQEATLIANMRFIHHEPNEQSIQKLRQIANQYDIETEVIYQDYPCPIVDFKEKAFQFVESTIQEIYPNIGVSPYVMTGGTDAKYYSSVCQHSIRFAPLYIDAQQYSSIHGVDENIYQATLPMGVDFYKTIIRKHK